MSKDLAMYILVNEDIKINKGKLAGQVGHAVATYFWNKHSTNVATMLLNQEYMKHQKKIILYASQNKLENLEFIISVGKPQYITIRDKGYTNLEPNTLTCVNLGILDKNNIPKELEFIKELKLCR